MVDVLYIGAAVVTVGGVLLWPVRHVVRRRAQRRQREADRAAELQLIAVDLAGAILGAHGRVATLGRLRASWFPLSAATALRLGEPLLAETAPIAALRGRISLLGSEETNRATDEVLHILEESVDLLTRSKLELRRVDWSGRETDIAQALEALDATVRQE